MLLEFGRWPLTVKPLTEPISVLPVLCDSAPGTRVAKLKSDRPLLAMLVRASTLERERPLAGRRLDFGHAARDADFFCHLADFHRERASRDSVVGVYDNIRSLERLEPLQGDLERVGVGSHDREHEATAFIGYRRKGVTLRAACQCDSDARKYSTLSVLNHAGDRCARGLRVNEGRDGQNQSQNGCQSRHRAKPSYDGHISSSLYVSDNSTPTT